MGLPIRDLRLDDLRRATGLVIRRVVLFTAAWPKTSPTAALGPTPGGDARAAQLAEAALHRRPP